MKNILAIFLLFTISISCSDSKLENHNLNRNFPKGNEIEQANTLDSSTMSILSEKKIEKNETFEDSFILFPPQNNGIEMKEISSFFSQSNIQGINNFIDREMGVTILYSSAIYAEYKKFDSLSANKKYYLEKNIPYWITDQIIRNFQPKSIANFVNTNDSIFECETIYKYGVFIDEGKGKSMMSQSISKLINVAIIEDWGEKKIKSLKEDLEKYKKIEPNSLRVVITTKNTDNSTIAFPQVSIYHFTKKNGKYYLTLMDFESYNCSV